MPQLINLGSELVRINTAANRIECSQNGGRGWVTRCANVSYGTLVDQLAYGGELLACTSKGLYVSTNQRALVGEEVMRWLRTTKKLCMKPFARLRRGFARRARSICVPTWPMN